MSTHIVKSFDAELAELDSLVAEIGGHAEKLLSDACTSLERRDPRLAAEAVANDAVIDSLERRIQENAIIMIARRQPMAEDLRHVMTVLKIAGDIERIGDLAKNIAKRSIALASESYPRNLVNGVRHMGQQALLQLKNVQDAVARRDVDAAMQVWQNDAGLDELYNSVFRELLTYMMEDPRSIGLCTHLLFAAKNLERIGDHATNIAENLHYLVKGTLPSLERPKSDETSTLLVGKD